MKKELIAYIVEQLKSYGYTVYVAKAGDYGFYTDGIRVVSFGGSWSVSVDFSGNYISRNCGDGWQIKTAQANITEEQAALYITKEAPLWATKGEVITYTTPEQHLATYGSSSGYVKA